MHFVYVIFNTKTKKYYVGESSNINRRLEEHKLGKNFSTKHYSAFWRLVYSEIYKSKKDAVIREKKLKSHGSGMVEIKKRILNSVQAINSKTGEGKKSGSHELVGNN